MKPLPNPQHWKQATKHYLKATGRLLVLVLFSIFPLIACAFMVLHRLWLLLVFLVLRLLGERILHWLGCLPRDHSLSTVHDKCSEIWDEFLEDVQVRFWRV